MRLAMRPAVLIVGGLSTVALALRRLLRVALVVAVALLSLLRAVVAVALLPVAAVVIVTRHVEA